MATSLTELLDQALGSGEDAGAVQSLKYLSFFDRNSFIKILYFWPKF